MAPSTFWIDAGSWIAASSRRVPPHRGHTNTSIRYTRRINSAHEYRRRPLRRFPGRLPEPLRVEIEKESSEKITPVRFLALWLKSREYVAPPDEKDDK